jgi:hypothetical protein
MAITTYAELQTAVADFLNRDDLTSAIPTFISLAETQMQREIRHHKMMQRSEAEIDSRYFGLPPEWLETVRFHVAGDRTYRLELTSMDDMLQLRQANADLSGRPTHFAHIGEQLEVYPTPDGTYDVELLYYEKIPALSESNTSNWLLADHPDAYLYGALMQSAPYLSEDARMQVWSTLYAGAVASINTETRKARYSGSGMRMRINSY